MTDIEITGNPDAPAIVVLGGISSSRHVTATTANPNPGWWNDFVGAEKAIDTLKWRVIGMDYISGDGDDALSTHHQARALLDVLDANGIGRLHAVVGASYGGMVALSLAELYPSRIERLIVIGAAHQSTPSATAHRSLQRKVVELGFRAGLESEAVGIARGMAMTTYSTRDQLESRFDFDDPIERELEIDRFLTLAGAQFASRCAPSRFLALSHSLDRHFVNPAAITCRTTLIGVVEDYLVPPAQLRQLAANLGGICELVLVSSIHGHDAFLEDQPLIAPIVTNALNARVSG
jgi:homoserine O-acetyltransferase/O-succinyltransferase